MKDCVGHILHIGDKVVCSDAKYSDLLLGEVIGFTECKIRVKCSRSIDSFQHSAESLKYPYQVYQVAVNSEI